MPASPQRREAKLLRAPDFFSGNALKIVRINDIVDVVSEYIAQPNIDLIYKAYVYSARVHQGHARANGEPYLNHPLWVAHLLAKLGGDEVTIAAGLLHDTLEDTWATREEVEELFGPTITHLVDGVTKLSKLEYTSKAQRKVESYRKMFVAMAEDLRVILIKLADRVHNMRTLEYLTDAKRQTIAQETMDLYAPLAGRLGIQWIRSELEDLSFRYLEPEVSAKLAKSIAEFRLAKESDIRDVVAALQQTLATANIAADISGREKNLYSIYKKMRERGLELEQIYDATAFRIIVHSVADCYAVVGLVHGRWTPIPGRFKDYIALPKANRYQSLHTTVIGPQGKPLEIQIRTYDMHRTAEMGVAAHWTYKEGDASYKSRETFEWLRQLYDWHAELKDSEQFVEAVRVDLFRDEVYVFTPQGDVVELPAGATPLDFAYKIHTEIGNKTSGAKINGRLVPLNTPLQNGNIVEILTSPSAAPKRDWLKLVRTTAARQKIRSYLTRADREHSLALGESLLSQAFKEVPHAGSQEQWFASAVGKRALKELKLNDRGQLVEALGYGRVSLARLKELLQGDNTEARSNVRRLGPLERLLRRGSGGGAATPILVDGLTGVQTLIANCCKPLPGDDVAGYVRAGKGIKIHLASCPLLKDANPDRIVPVRWGTQPYEQLQPVQLEIECQDSPGILGKIGQAISNQKINIVEISFRSKGDGKARGNVSLSVRNRKELDKVMQDISKLKGILAVQRL